MKGLLKMDLELREIELAAKRLEKTIHRTPVERSKTFSELAGADVYLKYENQQKTGSFKIRGASNKIAALVERGEAKSVVASSAGNHAQGVAYAAHVHNIPATIVMPKAAPIAKVQATEGYGAKVVLCGDCYDDAYKKALEICENEGATFCTRSTTRRLLPDRARLALRFYRICRWWTLLSCLPAAAAC